MPIKKIAQQTNCVICSVQYSLAPEQKFPKAVEESNSAVQWTIENINLFGGDPKNIFIGGDSSGGNLATVVVLKRKKVNDFKSLILIYPMLDATCSRPSIEKFGKGFGFTKEKINWYFDQYLPKNIDRRAPDISPFFVGDKELNGFPPTFIATAECDPIRDEAEIFAQRLKMANVMVKNVRYKGMIHGFFQMSGVLELGKTLIDDISKEICLHLNN